MADELAELRRRRDDLLASNNEFERRARDARRALATAKIDALDEIAAACASAAAVHSVAAAENVRVMLTLKREEFARDA